MAAAAAAAATRDGQTALALRLVKRLAPPADGDVSGGAGSVAGNSAFSPLSRARGAGPGGGRRARRHAGAAARLPRRAVGQGARRLRPPRRRLRPRRPVRLRRPARALRRRRLGRRLPRRARRRVPRRRRRVLQVGGAHRELHQGVPEATVAMINEWVKKATDNLIDGIISAGDINADTDLILANAVYFKGKWLEPFSPSWTEPGTFHLLDGGRAEADFMTDRMWMDVACMDGFKVLRLPYKHAADAADEIRHHRGRGGRAKANGKPASDADADGEAQYSMFVFRPDARDGIAAMVDVVTAAPSFLYAILAEMKEKPVDIKLPKFEISFSWDGLLSALRGLGLSLPFSPEAADLRGMCKGDDGVAGSPRRPTFLSKVAHMAVVKVNEVGTAAAAVMVGLCGGGGPPPDVVEFVADHPFTFLIMEERSGVIVFAGHVLDPTK
ncbi:hypothetical protein ACP4OV_027348 [Aristida adscensionis]